MARFTTRETARQALPATRSVRTGHMRWLQVVGGFLDGMRLELAPGLNCLIGARGSGKTTALELMRFALGALPSAQIDPDGHQRLETLLEENLRGGRVELALTTHEGTPYLVSRSWGEDPIVLTADGKATPIVPQGLLPVDIFSQNEIERIADCPASQLQLLDAFERDRLTAITQQIDALLQDLADNQGAFVPLQGRIQALTEELAVLPALGAQLHALTATGDSAEAINEAHRLKALRDQEKRTLGVLVAFLGEFDQQLEAGQGQIAGKIATCFCREVGTGPNETIMAHIRQALSACAAAVDTALDTARRKMGRLVEDLQETGAELTLRHHEQDLAFRRLIEHHAAAQDQAAERSKLETARNVLLAKQHQREELARQLENLQTKRTDLLGRLSMLRDQRFHLRNQVVQKISQALAGMVRVSLEQYGDVRAYQTLLAESLKAAKIKPQLVAPKLVQAFWPSSLAQCIRNGQQKRLEDEADLSAEQARKVIEALAGTEALLELETVRLEDRPKIELNHNGEYKESRALSTGQKCTTILPILLLDSDKPLLIDQPEDNLDNRFVFECIVASIRRVKTRRQLIFVTHNPNIPVLGDAERVLVLDSNGVSAEVAYAGTVDACRQVIVTLLEGGEEAFRQRMNRYHYA